jgi:hypothetical protein
MVFGKRLGRSMASCLAALGAACGSTEVRESPTPNGTTQGAYDASPREASSIVRDAAGETTMARADAPGSSDSATPGDSSDERRADAGSSCEGGRSPMPTGVTIDVVPPATLAAALASAHAGDRIVLHAGPYASERISSRSFSDFVFIEPAAGDVVIVPGVRFDKSDHVAFSGIRFTGTVMLDGSSQFVFHGVTLDGGASENAALQIHGQSAAGASHDIRVEDSKILGGGRTIFILGAFAPSDLWNHHLTF